MEDEGSGCSSHGNSCQGTDRLFGGTTPWYGANSFDAGTVRAHMGWQGIKQLKTLKKNCYCSIRLNFFLSFRRSCWKPLDQWSLNAGRTLFCHHCQLCLKHKNGLLFSVLINFYLFFFCSTELEKPCQGQPTISEVLEVVLKECRKDNLVYKIAALRCAGDVLQSSQQDCFSTLAEILFPLIKKV